MVFSFLRVTKYAEGKNVKEHFSFKIHEKTMFNFCINTDQFILLDVVVSVNFLIFDLKKALR